MKKTGILKYLLEYAAAFCLTGAVLLVGSTGYGASADSGPKTNLHYAPNHNFDSRNHFVPGNSGFNLADVSNITQVNALDAGVKGLVWVGQCNGVDKRFLATVRPFIGNPRVFGFYLMDDPDPRGIVEGNLSRPRCKAEDLKAESDWIHANMPGAKTFIVPMNMASSKTPSYEHTYNPANTNIDLFGIPPYPCRTESGNCDYDMIDRYILAAEAAGIPRARIVPIYQAFGGGGWVDDYQGLFTTPTVDQECHILSRWRRFISNPVFDMTYSWGVQKSDIAIERDPHLREFFALRNRGEPGACPPDISQRSARMGWQ
jgi:hypothetical protein